MHFQCLASLGHMVDATADVNHMFYYALGPSFIELVVIAATGNSFFIALLLRIGWFAQFSKNNSQIADFFQLSKWPFRQFLHNCRQTKSDD